MSTKIAIAKFVDSEDFDGRVLSIPTFFKEAQMLNCTFPSCNARLEPNQAKVPAIEAVRNATGKPVTVEDLAKFALCGRHSHVARKEGVQTYSYAGTAALLERRVNERETARAHFLQLRAKTQMGQAIAKALVPASIGSTGQSGQGALKLQPQSS